jgi:hypothetical protein
MKNFYVLDDTFTDKYDLSINTIIG